MCKIYLRFSNRFIYLLFTYCRFLDRNAFIYGLLVPSSTLTLIILSYLVRSAVVARYVISMQMDRRIRDKMSRKRTIQIILFLKVRFSRLFPQICNVTNFIVNKKKARSKYIFLLKQFTYFRGS